MEWKINGSDRKNDDSTWYFLEKSIELFLLEQRGLVERTDKKKIIVHNFPSLI